MDDQIYGQIYKTRALDRWENEGGRFESGWPAKAPAHAGEPKQDVRKKTSRALGAKTNYSYMRGSNDINESI